MRDRLIIAGRLLRAVLRSRGDADLRGDLLARLLDYEEYARLKDAIAAPRASVTTATGGASFPLLVTTNKGLFVLHDGIWRCLFPVVCFGIARHGDTLYLGASAGIHSFILKVRLFGAPADCLPTASQILFRYETRYHNERVHQIAYDPLNNQVLCANSRRNSVLAIDAETGKVVDEKFLFIDGTGFPVFTDQNHVNSVTLHGDIVLFAVHNAGGNHGALGFVANERVRAYRYQARGVHDVVIHDGGIMFTDSFRDALADSAPDRNGEIRYRGDDYLTAATDAATARKVVLRGLALRGGTVAVGFSAFGRRDARLSAGAGGVIVIGRDGTSQTIEGPFAQVYDVLPFDGVRSDASDAVYTADELDRMFGRDVGLLLYDAPVARNVRMAELR